MFVRFVVDYGRWKSSRKEGIFGEAYTVVRADDPTLHTRDHLKSLLEWFEGNLPLPDRSRLDDRAIFWFKASQGELIRRAWELAWCLDQQGVAIAFLKTRRPGRVVFEDRYQVAARPHRDTF